MAIRYPNWNIGESENYTSSGDSTDVTPIWHLGESFIRHEYVVVGGVVMPIEQINDIHSVIFGGQVMR